MKLVKRNQKLHNPDSPLLIGEVKDDDVKEVNELAILINNKNWYNFSILIWRCILNVVLPSLCGAEHYVRYINNEK